MPIASFSDEAASGTAATGSSPVELPVELTVERAIELTHSEAVSPLDTHSGLRADLEHESGRDSFSLHLIHGSHWMTIRRDTQSAWLMPVIHPISR